MTEVTPEQQALYALVRDLPRGNLPMAAQLEYDRLRPAWERGEFTDWVPAHGWEPTLLDQGQGVGEAELDASGMPVDDRPARGIADLGAIVTLVLGIVSLWAAITEYLPNHKRTDLVALAGWGSFLTMILALVVALLQEETKRNGRVSRTIVVVGGILGLVASTVAFPSWCPNCTA